MARRCWPGLVAGVGWAPGSRLARWAAAARLASPWPAGGRVVVLPVRRRWVVVGVVGAVGWRSGGRRGRGPAASRRPGRPDDGPGTAGRGWPGRWAAVQPVPQVVGV